jgi:hypothetical protein
MLKAGLMAREYGYTPTEMLGVNHLPTGKRFHLDYDIYAATSRHIEDQREQRREQMDPSSSRVAAPQERQNMIQDQHERAEQRESMEQAGMNAPSPEGQLSQLDEIMQQRDEAKQMQEQPGDDAPERVNPDG